MTDKHVQAEAPHSNMEKDPSDWVTGDEPMTGAQKSYLKTLSEEAGTAFDESLSKAAASERIDALQKETGRGAGGHGSSRHAGKSMAPTSSRPADEAPPANRKTTRPSAPGAPDDEPDGDLFEAAADGTGAARWARLPLAVGSLSPR